MGLVNEIKNLLARVIIFWPSTPFGNKLRDRFYRRYLNSLGKDPKIESGVRFGDPGMIDVGDNCLFGRNVNVNAGNCYGIYLGSDLALAEGTYLRSGNHSFSNMDIPILNQGHYAKEIDYKGRKYSIVIEDNVWVGAHSIILSGAKIGTGSVIGAGARVSSEIPPNSIVVGNPGVIVGTRENRKGKN